MSLVLQSSGGGSVTLEEAVTASNLTITVPAETGTMITTASTFSGTGPAFKVTLSGDVSITGGVNTKVPFNTEDFDTASCFDTSTNRFTPNVAGYYQINLFVALGAATSTQATIRKNGTSIVLGWYMVNQASYGGMAFDVVYMNGTTDYIEGFMFVSANSTIAGGSAFTGMSGFLARAA
jgi:hypothetical protein